MADSNNLLVRLHGWVNRQDENFTTEAFVYVLRHLLDNEPQTAVWLLKRLTNGAMDVPSEKANSISVRTQVTTTEGRPDVEIRTNDHLVFIEVKVQSVLESTQLKRYRSNLQASGVAKTCLVLLTRYFTELTAGGETPDSLVRWYQIADWLFEAVDSEALTKVVSSYIVQQFLGFLAGRGMTMEQVGWELVSGVQALCNLCSMLEEAALACKVSIKPSNSQYYTGYFIANKRYWLGLSYGEPGLVSMSTVQVRIDRDKATKLGKGKQWEEGWVPGRWRWGLDLDLQAEEVHFFARSRASQMQCLEKFIREFLEDVKIIEAADQPATTATDLADDSTPFANETKG